MRATDRDRDLVEWIGRTGAVEADQVGARFGLTRSPLYRRLGGLVESGLLEHHRLLHAAPGLYVATRAGMEWAGIEFLDPCRVSAGAARHWSICGEVALLLEDEFGIDDVRSDREIRAIERIGGVSASAVVANDGPVPRRHRPDFAVWGEDGRWRLAVEVELTVKSPRRLSAICRGFARNRDVTEVRYYAEPAPARAVERAAKRVYASDLFDIRPLPDLGRQEDAA